MYKSKEARKYFIAVEKQWQALKQQQIQLKAKNFGFNEAGKFFGTNGTHVNRALKAGRYLRPNGNPYEKYILHGYFNWELYDERFTSKHVTITPDKGMPLLGKLLGKTNMPVVSPVTSPVTSPANNPTTNPPETYPMQANGFQVPALKQNIMEIIIEDHNTLTSIQNAVSTMINYIIMVKSGIGNKFEEEKYMAALKTFHANNLKSNKQLLEK